jgi:hypothetical protein
MMGATVAGRQGCKSSHTTNKRLTEKLLARWETENLEGRFSGVQISRFDPFCSKMIRSDRATITIS